MPRTQRHERRHEIDRLEELWRSAVLKNDTAAMSSLLSNDYIAITPTGTVQTKDEALAAHRDSPHFKQYGVGGIFQKMRERRLENLNALV